MIRHQIIYHWHFIFTLLSSKGRRTLEPYGPIKAKAACLVVLLNPDKRIQTGSWATSARHPINSPLEQMLVAFPRANLIIRVITAK